MNFARCCSRDTKSLGSGGTSRQQWCTVFDKCGPWMVPTKEVLKQYFCEIDSDDEYYPYSLDCSSSKDSSGSECSYSGVGFEGRYNGIIGLESSLQVLSDNDVICGKCVKSKHGSKFQKFQKFLLRRRKECKDCEEGLILFQETRSRSK